ncbi:glycoside hydrolase family 2 protein [Patulibacter minatonensis]|uniref:glycoside hydrolase family 2 protein n=1 Tax=Patulibacter minatonensis TaxID=298163 RepID=UPI00047903EE|nr:glycoside hydrolase family 2 [Patulibacter minatonensis]
MRRVPAARRLLIATATFGVLVLLALLALRAGSANGAAGSTGNPLGDLLAPVTGPAGGRVPPDAQSLASGWSRVQDPADDGVAAARPSGAGAGWTAVAIPDVTQPQPTPASYAGSVWWYKRQLQVPAADAGSTWALRFEGVRRIASVYLDGRELVQNDDPYSPFEVELPQDSAGRTVTVVVRVDGRRPSPLSEGWWNWTGIVRPVTLVPRAHLNTVDPAVQGAATCTGPDVCDRSVRVRADVQNRTGAALPLRARVTLTDDKGQQLAADDRDLGTVGGGAQRSVSVDVPAPRARLWSPSSPVLYTATIELVSGTSIEQRIVRRIGFRSVTAVGSRLQLNGRELRLRGGSIQEDLPGRGAGLSDADVQRIVQDLEDVKANVTRAHYTLDERLLSALDRAGIMVWSQAPIYQSTTRLDDPGLRERALRSNQRAVIASRNHPSVIVHSVANELSPVIDKHQGAVDYLAKARSDTQALDPTVPAAIDLVNYPGYPAQQAYGAFPVLGLNTYFGWYDGRPGHSTGRFKDFAPFLTRIRKQYPAAAMAITEMGAEGVRNGARTKKGTLQFQNVYFNRIMNVIDSRKDLSGALYWTVREFGIKPGWTGGTPSKFAKKDGIHRKGLLTYYGKPKPVWYSARNRLDGSTWAVGAPVRSKYGR